MNAGCVRETRGRLPTSLWLWVSALGVMFTSAAGCARDSQAVPVRTSTPVAAAPAPDPSPPPPKTAPRADVVDKDACQLARAELKRLQQQAAGGCKTDGECVLDADCLA